MNLFYGNIFLVLILWFRGWVYCQLFFPRYIKLFRPLLRSIYDLVQFILVRLPVLCLVIVSFSGEKLRFNCKCGINLSMFLELLKCYDALLREGKSAIWKERKSGSMRSEKACQVAFVSVCVFFKYIIYIDFDLYLNVILRKILKSLPGRVDLNLEEQKMSGYFGV